MILNVIWWSSDSGTEPSILLSDDEISGRRAFVEFMTGGRHVTLTDLYEIDAAWVAEFPAPDLDDETAVQAWCDALKEATTDAWLLQYNAKTEDVLEGSDTQYRDKRTYRPMPARQVQPGDVIEGGGTVRWVLGPMTAAANALLPYGGMLITFTADTQMGVPNDLVLNVHRPVAG